MGFKIRVEGLGFKVYPPEQVYAKSGDAASSKASSVYGTWFGV